MKKKVALALALTLVAGSVSLDAVTVAAKSDKIVANVKGKTLSLKKGEKIKLKAVKGVKLVSFKSSDKKVVKINKKGKVKAVDGGEAVIKVTANTGAKQKIKVSVLAIGNVAEDVTPDLSYEGFELKWEDNFDGDSLDMTNWNIETHEPGWVNAELQEYVTSDANIFVKDGELHLKAIKDGDNYTSGRVNTQGKQDYTYGLFEATVKFPEGQGFLPAFWMMPTDENLYGQWPRCGEIDIAEVMGQTNNKLFGTIHYGNPHMESQGTYIIPEGNFTDDYHTFSVEWEPGKLIWYVDGIKYHEENDWFTATGNKKADYPAPFNQPFYMILNLAVGGSWVGYPDETTNFDTAEVIVDSVRVYQKDSYDENVVAPEKTFNPKDPDANGNYIVNGNFAEAEALSGEGDKDWTFLTANGGEATAEIKDKAITIKTTNEGTVDYSVQLVQPNVPFEKGATYEVGFKAKASAEREMNCAVKAPDRGWVAYFTRSVELTTELTDYVYTFKMGSDSDENGRLEYNMGATGSTADITITDVYVKKIKDADPNEEEVPLYDETALIKNGSFAGDLECFEVYLYNTADASYVVDSLTEDNALDLTIKNTNDVEWKIQVKQNDVALEKGVKYKLSFDIRSSIDRTFQYAIQRDGAVHKDANGNEDWQPYVQETLPLKASTEEYTRIEKEFTMDYDNDEGAIFNIALGGGNIDEKHRICIDNILLEKVQ